MAERTPEEIAAAKRRLEEAGLEVTDKMIEAEIKLREAAARTLETREKNLEALEEQLAKLEGLIEKDADGDFARRERKKALAALAMKAYRDEIAIIEDSNNSALTFGPTFSTLLKSISAFKLSVNFFLISGINLLLLDSFCSTLIK